MESNSSILSLSSILSGFSSILQMPKYRRARFDSDDLSVVSNTLASPARNVNSIELFRSQTSENLISDENDNDNKPAAATVRPVQISAQLVTGESGSGVTSVTFNKSLDRKKLRSKKRTESWRKLSKLEKYLILCFSIIFLAFLFHYIHLNIIVYRKDAITCLSPYCVSLAGETLGSMDLTADPCDDFYQYACGNWKKSNPSQNEKPVSFLEKIEISNLQRMKDLLLQKEKSNSEAIEQAKIFYRSCMDLNGTIDKLNIQPAYDILFRMGGWNISAPKVESRWNFQKALEGATIQFGVSLFFDWEVVPRPKNSSIYEIQISYDPYTINGEKLFENKTIFDQQFRPILLEYMTRVGVLLGGDRESTRLQMNEIIDFEYELFALTITMIDNSDNIEHYYTVEELNKYTHFDIKKYFENVFVTLGYKFDNNTRIINRGFDFLAQLDKTIELYMSRTDKKTSVATYMSWHVLRRFLAYLPPKFNEFNFKMAAVYRDLPARWQFCVKHTINSLRFATGAMFVEKFYNEEYRSNSERLITYVKTAFKRRLARISWMDDQERTIAIEKVDNMKYSVGYPDWIVNYKKLDDFYSMISFNELTFMENAIHDRVQRTIRSMILVSNRMNNKTDWLIDIPLANAYYNRFENRIVLPAGVVQPPLQDFRYPKSVIMAQAGFLIGHEICHGFDNNGRLHDSEGIYIDWWRNVTVNLFEKNSKCLISRYSKYNISGHQVDGNLTLSENIADLGGIRAAYQAWIDWSRDDPPETSLPGLNFTQNKLFFLKFAQFFCGTEPSADEPLPDDPHSPGPIRVSGVLSNFDHFAEAFSCPINSKMNPWRKCGMW